MTIKEKLKAEIERLKQEGDIALQDAVETNDIESGFVCGGIISTCEKLLTKLDTLQEQPVMIEWTGNNLKEVIEFTGKSPRFDEWFKTWDEYESYVHSHGNVFKLFNEDGTHLEVPVGAWIFKTPDGRNVPSTFLYKEQPVDWQKIAEAHAKDQPLGQDNNGNLVYLQEQPICEGLDMEIDRYFRNMKLRANTPPIPDEYIDEETVDNIARHFYELGRQSKKRELLPMIERICVSCPEKVKAESALNKFISKHCVHCSIEHCPGVKACYTSSNGQLQ